MKILSRFHLFSRLLAAGCLWLACAMAQQPPPAPAQPATPAAGAPPAASEASAASAAEATTSTPPLAAPAEPADGQPPLRRIDEPTETPVSTPAAPNRVHRNNRHGGGDFPFGDHVVPAGSRISDAVSIFGSNVIEGEVFGDSVSVIGHTTIGRDAVVKGAAVAVLGRLDSKGRIGQDAVSVLGGVTIDGHVRGEVVSVLGNMHLGPNAIIDGDLVIVGGQLTKDPNAIVRGNEVRVPLLGAGSVESLTAWITRCALWGRLLGFGPNLGWAWVVACSFLAFYVVLALLFAKSMDRCVTVLETRPGFSIVASVLTVLLTPVAIVLLAVTVVGALLIPFVGAGLIFAKLFGKAVMLAWLGRRLTKPFRDGPLGHPAFAVLVGGLVVMLLYTIPVAGVLFYKLFTWLGLGVVVYTIALNLKREKAIAAAAKPTAPPPPGTRPPAPVPPVVPPDPTPAAAGIVSQRSAGFSDQTAFGGAASLASSGFAAAAMAAPPDTTAAHFGPAPGYDVSPAAEPAHQSFSPPPASVPASTLPRATFFIRMAALLLDLILVGIVVKLCGNLLPHFLQFHPNPGAILLALAIYGSIMWKTKGTTIGGIVCGLKVVRVDSREIDWTTAWVRALSCFLSLAVAGLGFIWIAIDDEKQSWHDKIAGTAVVRLPKGVSLI